jgi:adenine-specific DNA-methyltransferase
MKNNSLQIAYDQVQILINDFEAGLKHYLSASYQEAEVRKEYIDKFYTALGWDVNHDYQKNPFEQEVKIEKAQRQQGALGQKRADYAFFLAPNYKQVQFFVEAKKPSRTLLQNKDDYFQTAKYGWNAGTKISILTDFEELVIIDCRNPPNFDTILDTKIKYYKYTDFRDFDTFEELYWIFSKQALLAGNLPKYIDNLPKPKGSGKQIKMFGKKHLSIDESFLNYIDQKRLELALSFYKNNPKLDAYELTEATQRTIDRIVFIKFLEDKLIETEAIIHNIATHPHPWSKFVEYTKYLDGKYNGVVFKPLFIDDKNFGGADADSFRSLCSDLDHTNSPYDFNYIPIHILGSIYERFLGKTIEINNNGACSVVSIEIKPEVRKAGGVFYTPKYIVDYIVENTIGKLITTGHAPLSPKEISKLSFADIACGSGSFLIGVFEYLLDYHNKYYNDNPAEAKKDGCKYNEDLGLWVLSIQQKQQILLNNIYGVDIDMQATEVTQLSLFLKMLEDETTSSTNDMQVLFHEKILPNLTNNIKCGNSLIGTDILNTKLDLDLHQERKLNPFDFKMAFPKVFGKTASATTTERKGVATTDQKGVATTDQERVATTEHAPLSNYGFDAIVGNPPYVKLTNFDTLETDYFNKNYKTKNDLYALFIEKAFTYIKEDSKFGFIIPSLFIKGVNYSELRNLINKNTVEIELTEKGDKVFYGVKMPTCILICKKGNSQNDYFTKENQIFSRNTIILDEIVKIRRGIEIGKDKLSNFGDIICLNGSSINKYQTKQIKYIPKETFELFKKDLEIFNGKKIIIRETGDGFYSTIDNNSVTNRSLYNVKVLNEDYKLEYLQGIISSNLFQYYFNENISADTQIFPKLRIQQLKQLPISIITSANQDLHDQIVTLVEQMLKTKSQQQTAVTERDKSYLDEKCKNLDAQINNLVYALYELDAAAIAIIEKKN